MSFIMMAQTDVLRPSPWCLAQHISSIYYRLNYCGLVAAALNLALDIKSLVLGALASIPLLYKIDIEVVSKPLADCYALAVH
jgi:hypothetical protein